MKHFFEKWWDKNTKCFSIISYKKVWKENGIKPRIYFYHNGAKRSKGDSCLDVNFIVGYTVFNYTNFDLQKKDKEVSMFVSKKKYIEVVSKLESLLCYATGGKLSKHTYKLRVMENAVLDNFEDLRNNDVKEAIRTFAEDIKLEFYQEFDEIIPSIMADKIDELVKKYIGGERE